MRVRLYFGVVQSSEKRFTEVGRYRKVIPPVDDISAGFLKERGPASKPSTPITRQLPL